MFLCLILLLPLIQVLDAVGLDVVAGTQEAHRIIARQATCGKDIEKPVLSRNVAM